MQKVKQIDIVKTNSWRIKDANGAIKTIPITELTDSHLINATISSLINVDKLRKEQELLESKLSKLKLHIQNCSLSTLNMFNEIDKRNNNNKKPIVINFPKSRIVKLHPEIQEIFFEEEFNNLISTKDINFVKSKAIPILAK